MAALTLIEAAKLYIQNGEDVRGAVVQMFGESNNVMRYLPFTDINGNALNYAQEGTLPGVAFRGVNESFTPSTGVINPIVEPLRIAGGEVDVDTFIIDTMGMEARSTHEAMKIKAITQDFQRVFFKGDNATNKAEPDGLQNRLTGDQVISNASGSPLAAAALSLAKLDETIDAVSNPTHIFMSKALKRRLSAAARSSSISGNIQMGLDQFGASVMLYNGIPVVAIADAADKDTVLTFTETASVGSSNASTSIYVVSLMPGMLTGIQSAGGMNVRDLGELDDKPVYRTRVQWYASIALLHSRAAARLRDIIDGAVTA
jgi:hypothetical protein